MLEPDATLRERLGRVLGRDGCEVEAVAEATEALAGLARVEVDVLVLDVPAVEPRGLEVIRAARRSAARSDIVLIGEPTLDTAIECLRLGVAEVVRAPPALPDLVEAVERVLVARRERSESALRAACQAIFAARDPIGLAAAIVESARDALDADDASLMLVGADGRLYVAESASLSPEVRAAARIAVGDRVAGRVAQGRTPMLINGRLDDDERFAGVSQLGQASSSIVHPLWAGDRLLGILNLSRFDDPRPFGPADLGRCELLAAQVVLSLDNARLVEHMVASDRLASIGQLAAGVAHEINNPVSYVLANLEFLRERLGAVAALGALIEGGAPAPELRAGWDRVGHRVGAGALAQAVSDAIEGADRIRSIVRDMRALARADDGDDELIDLNETIRAALRIAGAAVRPHAYTVTRLGTDTIVRAAAGRLSQVFVNLLVNAAQAMAASGAARGTIVVSSGRHADRIVASVADDGPGIAAAHLPRVFEPFFTTKDAGTGTGLGLAICQQIVRRHRGELSVMSSPGRGAVFTVSLPAARPDELVEPASSPPSRRLRLLFIDDERALLRVYERTFAGEHDVAVAASGAEALAALAQRSDYDAVVCDVLMPDLSGMEVYGAICAGYAALADRVLFATGAAGRPDIEQFLRRTSCPVLEKPFAPGALRDAVLELAGRA